MPHLTADWTNVLIAFAALVVALVVLVVSFVQCHIARRTLKFSLYDRRWKIYAETENILRVVAYAHGLQDEISRLQTYLSEFMEDTFLLPDAARASIESVKQLVAETRQHNFDFMQARLEPDQQKAILAFETWNGTDKVSELQKVRAELETAFRKCIDFTDV